MLRVVYDCHSSLSRSIRPFFDVVLEKDLESINKVRYESIERHMNMMLLFTAITICVFSAIFARVYRLSCRILYDCDYY